MVQWYEILVRDYLVRSVVRDFGTILFGSLRGTKFWYQTQWFGSYLDFWFVISGPVPNGSVLRQKKIGRKNPK